jgi:hypothetical protein
MFSRLLPAVFVCALAVSLGQSSADGAQKAAKKQASPYAKQIYELHDVKVLLERADHDYKGHRAAAVKLISAAIHSLQMGYAHVKHPSQNVKGGGEPQALSDKQLQEAKDKLAAIQKQLSATQADMAVQSAANDLNMAVAELTVALTIK